MDTVHFMSHMDLMTIRWILVPGLIITFINLSWSLSVTFPNQIEQEKFKLCLFFQLYYFLFAPLIQLLDFKKPSGSIW